MGPGGGGGGGGGMSDIFDMLSGNQGRQRGPRKGEDVVHRLRVSMEELYNGSTRHVMDPSCGIQYTIKCISVCDPLPGVPCNTGACLDAQCACNESLLIPTHEHHVL